MNRSFRWLVVSIAVTLAAGCASKSPHPLHRLAASDHNIVAAGPLGGGAGDWYAWPSLDLANDPLRYDFGYQLNRYRAGPSPSSYPLARRPYTPQIYGYPDKGVGIYPYRHRHVPPSVNTAHLPRRYTRYPGVPGYRSHGTQNVYGYRSYGYGRSIRGPVGGGFRGGVGFPR